MAGKEKKRKTSHHERDSYLELTENHNVGSKAYFVCPRHGRIPREEVAFLCNTCGPQEMVLKNGMYLCPQCLKPGRNFQCRLCDSTEVELRERKPPAKRKSKKS